MEKQKKTTEILTITSIMTAIRLALKWMPSLNIGNVVQMGVGFIGSALSGALLGPWRAALVGVFVDIFGTLLKGNGGNFFFGYTLTALVSGLIYGFFLYKKPITWQRVVLTVLVVTLVCNLGMNSIWIHLQTQKAFAVFMQIRIIKNLISFPLNSVVLLLLLKNKTMQHLLEKYRI